MLFYLEAAAALALLIPFAQPVASFSVTDYLCKDGRSRLDDVFDHYGPLCDQRRDCPDGSDEEMCNYHAQNQRYTGK